MIDGGGGDSSIRGSEKGGTGFTSNKGAARPAATTISEVSSEKRSLASSSTIPKLQDQKTLGYRPFEYWKGPKPVIPGAPHSHARHKQRPRTPGKRLTQVFVTALNRSTADVRAQPSSTAFPSKLQIGKGTPSHTKNTHKSAVSVRLQNMGRSQDQYGGQYGGQYGNGQYGNGQYANGQYGNGEHGNGQYGNHQYGNGQYGNGQYGNGQYGDGQYGNGQYENGQYGDGQYGGYYGGQAAGGPASYHVRDVSGEVELLSGPPPTYNQAAQASARAAAPDKTMEHSSAWWNPRTWSKKAWGIIIGVLVVIIIIAVVVGVLEARANRYPDYTALSYSLKDTYSGSSFFDDWDYFTGYDTTSGFVHYVPRAEAESLNLTYAGSSSAVLRVDTSVGNTSNPDASTGRFSVRVTSQTQYESGLFIFDIKHTPYGCGTWPALWLSDPSNWPTNGEIDVMEAVNQANTGNQMTLHTTDNCEMKVKRKQTGSVLDKNCYNETNDNAGCGVKGTSASYGTTFNSNGGGVMAMEWRDAGIRIWQFDRDSIPSDISNDSPDPSTWGTAAADFPDTECSISSHFRNQSIIANIDLCGTWAGAVYEEDGCPSSCTDYVANYPSAFENAYWEFGSFKVFSAS